MGLIVLVTLVNHPLFLLMALFSQITLNILQDGGKRLNKSLKYYVFWVDYIHHKPFISHRVAAFFLLFGQSHALEAMVFGFSMIIITYNTISFISYNMVITPDKFMFLFLQFSKDCFYDYDVHEIYRFFENAAKISLLFKEPKG